MIGSRHSKYMDISLFCYNQGAMDDVGSAAFQWAQYGPIGSLTIRGPLRSSINLNEIIMPCL